jgi:hypothetical protein
MVLVKMTRLFPSYGNFRLKLFNKGPSMIPQARQKENSFSYAKVQDSLVKALSIDGALGVALGDWKTGMCLG